MAGQHGKFVWYELMTTDPQAAESFYGKVFGWAAESSGHAGRDYTVIRAGAVGIGGIMKLTEEMRAHGIAPHWGGYIAVDDVDASADRVKQSGGSIHKAPEDIPEVGRFAVVADPFGAAFMLFKGTSDQAPAPQGMPVPGTVGWNECHGGAPEEVFSFYADLFGWTKGTALEMGPGMGTYQLFKVGENDAGGMMKKMPELPVACWIYYVNVEDIDATHKRVVDNGGQVVFGPTEVPGGMWIIQALDPQKALFAMVGPKKA